MSTSLIDTLSPREREITGLLIEHYQNQGIADLLGISVNTVNAHRSRIMLKLNAKTMREVYLLWTDRDGLL